MSVILRSASLVLFAMFISGCRSTPTSSSPDVPSSDHVRPAANPQTYAQPGYQPDILPFRRSSRRAKSAGSSQPGDFDFYLLTLSWSPEFCATHQGSPECATHPGFVVHGLWPQNVNRTYPENCSDEEGPANPQQYLNLLPTVSLIEHEWATHGTCSGLAPDAYFGTIALAFHQVRFPAAFVNGNLPSTLPPDAIINQFAQANPGWPQGSIALSCGKNYLTAVEVCLSKTLKPQACQNVHTCGATVVKITPR